MENYEKTLRKLVIDLFNVNAVKFGEFKTKVGILTPVYCDLRVVVSYPNILRVLSDLIEEKTKNIRYDLICGVPYTALPIATALSLKIDKPMVMRRKEKKDYGTKKLIEGDFNDGDRCLIVEDVVTSGGSVLETCQDLQNSGIKVSEAVVLLNREQGGETILKENGINMIALLTLSQLILVLKEENLINEDVYKKVLKYIKENQIKTKHEMNRLKLSYSERIKYCKNPVSKELFKIMDAKKSNLCVAADLTNATDILNLAEEIGPFICLLKLHVDIIEDFHENFIKRLQEIASTHNFLLFEDRKFSDIGKTVQNQYTKGIYHISNWATLITAHSLMGNGTLRAIEQSMSPNKKSGVFLLAESSTEGLINPEYTKATIEMGKTHIETVTGFVCQSPKFLDEPQFIQLTPGVQINESADDCDQRYTSPEAAINEKGADVVVVGRGITKSNDFGKIAEKYRRLLWESYQNRISIE
ncbi:uridine 5'-monophosphate synthase [Onthophagus taurus]|uniref:uridine 5'-monophosphate synthase n=1 Tax=Onthophagus taurus TaxID=166361 RepID=UPI000C2055F1|nr:uridine 5'-monophosphate synthase [Onthophagus taurus]